MRTNKYSHEFKLRTKYSKVINDSLKDIKKSPIEGDRMLESILKKMKERAINRTVKISWEIKQNSEWTMDKLVNTVVETK